MTVIEILLLTTILVGQIVIVWAILEFKRAFLDVAEAWGRKPTHASGQLKALQEIVDMMHADRDALHRRELSARFGLDQ